VGGGVVWLRGQALPSENDSLYQEPREGSYHTFFQYSTSKLLHLPPQNDDSGLAVEMLFR
jgi:hypothetical protein